MIPFLKFVCNEGSVKSQPVAAATAITGREDGMAAPLLVLWRCYVVDTEAGSLLPDLHNVYIRDGRIERLGVSETVSPDVPGAQVLDCQGMFLLPGEWTQLHVSLAPLFVRYLSTSLLRLPTWQPTRPPARRTRRARRRAVRRARALHRLHRQPAGPAVPARELGGGASSARSGGHAHAGVHHRPRCRWALRCALCAVRQSEPGSEGSSEQRAWLTRGEK